MMAMKKYGHKEMKKLVLKVISDCRELAKNHIKNWKPINKKWEVIEGAAYLRLSDDAQVAIERGSLEQQIHIAVAEAEYRSELEKVNYKITEFYIEPGVTGTHGNRPEFIRLQKNIDCKLHQFIIFKEIARLVRDLEIWKRFFRLCQESECEIFIRGLPFNPNDPASILLLDQLAAYAEFESRTTSKRIKESNHSALITSGKFNNDSPLLGFDVVKNKLGENSGFYEPNEKELKQVEWIMTSFLKVDRYKTLLDWCKEKNIKSKSGRYFNQSTLKALLQNSRFIGKWYRNKHNKDRKQSKLMPYDRYVEVSLPHGSVIDEKLWDQVQVKIKSIAGSRAKSTKRCYPLSGLLQYEDGSPFVGSSAWGETTVSTYYYNAKNSIRVKAHIFEEETKKILKDIVDNSEKFQKSLTYYLKQKKAALDFIDHSISEIDIKISALSDDNDKLHGRLDFLLANDDKKALSRFKGEDTKKCVENMEEIENLNKKKDRLLASRRQLDETQIIDVKHCLKRANEVLKYVTQKDFPSLKSIYQNFFEKVIVRPLPMSQIQLEFVYRHTASLPPMDEVDYCTVGGLERAMRFERTTSTLEGWHSTN